MMDGFDIERFLRDHWQKRPLLIRGAFPSLRCPITPDELAGLACEEGVEARIATQAAGGWTLEHGPFAPSRFAQAAAGPWTLLVQAVDHHVADVAALIEPFRFIPDWRIDDVMVSYATDGGGVGPHFDHYDVFLVQSLGRRRWRVGARCDDAAPLVSGAELKLLAQFEPLEEWVLEPGDVLYLPPRHAHEGVAVGDDCVTCSIGFRAPARGELVAGWAEHLAADMPDSDRYADPHLRAADNPGEIPARAIAELHAMVTEALHDRAAFARWFGRHASTPRYPDVDWRPEVTATPADVRAALAAGVPLVRNPASRFAFVRPSPGTLALFVDGVCFECGADTAPLAERLAGETRLVPPQVLTAAEMQLVLALLNRGSVAFDPD